MKEELLEQTERLIKQIADFERVLELEIGEEIREKRPDDVQFIQDAKSKLQESFVRRIKALPDAIETDKDKQHAKYIQIQLRSITQEMKNLTRMQREIEARTPEEHLLQKKQRYQNLLLRVIEAPKVETKYRADKEIKHAIEEHEKLVTNLGGLIKETFESQDEKSAYDDLILLLKSYQLKTESFHKQVQDRTISLDTKASSLPRKKQLIEYLLKGVIAEPEVAAKYRGDIEITGALDAHRTDVLKFTRFIEETLRLQTEKPAADERVYDDLIALLESDPIKTTSLHETVKQRIETLDLREAQKAEERDLAQKHEQQLSEQKTIKHALIEKLGPLSAVKRREFTFSEEEAETLTQIQTQKDTLERADDVLFNDDELTRTQQTIERLTGSFKKTLETHRQIKNFLEHSPEALIPFLVKQDDERWLETASQYQPRILADIENALSKFETKEAIGALKTFAEKQGSPSLKEKAKWMSYLADKGVEDPAQYVRKEDVLNVLKELERLDLLGEISGEALQDEHFITAVQTLMDSKMLSEENLNHLIGSPAKRDVIANRPDVFRIQLKSPSHTTPLEEGLQSKLLDALLEAGENVALAIGHVQDALMSGLIPVLMANEALTELLSGSNSATNLLFLNSELRRTVLTASTYVDDFFSDRRELFEQNFIMGNEEILKALNDATKDPAAYDLATMAKVVQSIDDYIRDYNGNKKSLIAFRKDVIPQVLLTTKTPSEKADAVSKLAKSHFKHRHAVARVLLDIIVKGILGVFAYPAYLLGRKSGKEPYFFSRQETKRFKTLKEKVLPELGEAEESTQTPDDDSTNQEHSIDSASEPVTPKAAGVAEEDEDNVEEAPRVRLR